MFKSGVGRGQGEEVEGAAGGGEKSDPETATEAAGNRRHGRVAAGREGARVAPADSPPRGREIRPREALQTTPS